ncbi:MAG: DUF364 domain-containing protein [Desulfobacteraceae bacterium]|nr:DUF364 domain-containing protein [Desulfobacteraceae bacterium]
MTIAEKLLEVVNKEAKNAEPLEIRIGLHWTVALLQRGNMAQAGISSTLETKSEHHHGGGHPVNNAGFLLEQPAAELASMMHSSSLPEAGVGLATINALLDVNPDKAHEVNAADVILERGANRKVAIVGHFPFTEQVREAAETLWVLELDPRKGDIEAYRAPEIIPAADVVAITGTSLINHTFDELMGMCRLDAFVIVLGGTTPLSDVLFDFGVDAVAGTYITDPEAALKSGGQGATFKQLKGKRLLTMFKDD